MSFALLDDQFHSNPKIVAAGLDGAGLYARALSYCGDYLTDGYVPLAWAKEIARPALRTRLTSVGLWLDVKGGESFVYQGEEGATYTVIVPGPGYFIEDYLTLNPTRASAVEKREDISRKRSDAGKKGALARWQKAKQTDGKHDGKPMANDWQTDGPLSPSPSPSPESINSIPAFTSYEGEDFANEEHAEYHLEQVIQECGGTNEAREKLSAAFARRRVSEARLARIAWAVRQPGTKDRLGKALSMLTKEAA